MAQRACTRCNQKRLRCTKSRPACDRCVKAGTASACVYPAARRVHPALPRPNGPGPSAKLSPTSVSPVGFNRNGNALTPTRQNVSHLRQSAIRDLSPSEDSKDKNEGTVTVHESSEPQPLDQRGHALIPTGHNQHDSNNAAVQESPYLPQSHQDNHAIIPTGCNDTDSSIHGVPIGAPTTVDSSKGPCSVTSTEASAVGAIGLQTTALLPTPSQSPELQALPEEQIQAMPVHLAKGDQSALGNRPKSSHPKILPISFEDIDFSQLTPGVGASWDVISAEVYDATIDIGNLDSDRARARCIELLKLESKILVLRHIHDENTVMDAALGRLEDYVDMCLDLLDTMDDASKMAEQLDKAMGV